MNALLHGCLCTGLAYCIICFCFFKKASDEKIYPYLLSNIIPWVNLVFNYENVLISIKCIKCRKRLVLLCGFVSLCPDVWRIIDIHGTYYVSKDNSRITVMLCRDGLQRPPIIQDGQMGKMQPSCAADCFYALRKQIIREWASVAATWN